MKWKGERMRLFIMLIFCAAVVLFLGKPLKKHSTIFYCVSLLLAVAGYFVQTRMISGLLQKLIADYSTSGILSTSLFVLVMYASVFPSENRSSRCFLSLRGELSIAASILSLSHIAYGGHQMGKMVGNQRGFFLGGHMAKLAAAFLLLLLIPLFVTSFKGIRKKMSVKLWKKIQRWSYLFYGLLYLHIAAMLCIKAPSGNWNHIADLCCYTAVFGTYTVLRLKKYLKKKNCMKQDIITA